MYKNKSFFFCSVCASSDLYVEKGADPIHKHNPLYQILAV